MLLDVFDGDAFTMQSLTLAIDKLPYMPSRIGKLGLFRQTPITTRHAMIEERQGILALVPTMARGSSQQTTAKQARRKVRSFEVPHMPQWDDVLAEALEGKRLFGSETETEVFSVILNDKMEALKANQEVTWEYHRIGALFGKILDADGTTVVEDYFADFGITQETVSIDFSDSGTYALPAPAVDLKKVAAQVYRAIQNALGATPFTGVRAFCGNQFWDAFIAHGTVRKAYEYWTTGKPSQMMNELQIADTPGGGGFEFADITWENYRGFIGNVTFFPTTSCIFFPTGTRDIYLEIPAPADFMETVNTRGLPLYAKQERMEWDKGIKLHVQSNMLYMCTRPQVLIKGNGSNFPTEPTVS